jgi:quercetin dioxygenase-like cupin family protein
MPAQRLFHTRTYFVDAEGDPVRSVVCETEHTVVVAWQVRPGQRIGDHFHPTGQDTWTVLSGSGLYSVDGQGATLQIGPGDVLVARPGEVHGVLAQGDEPLRIVSCVSPSDAGYHPLN